MQDTQSAVVVARAGILVNVPTPARYALHKLVTSTRRASSFQTKTLKDIDQAALLLTVLLEHRPGDIQLAFEAAHKMPEKFVTQLVTGLKKLPDTLQDKVKLYLHTN